MFLVLALGGHPTSCQAALASGHPHYLVSFAYKKAREFLTDAGITPSVFILDSGAFSAWNSGVAVSLAAYMRYAQETVQLWPHTHMVNLDVIPGEAGRSSTGDEREEGMGRSLQHADTMRSAGFRVMEVFHQDEPVTFLEQLIARRRPGELLGLSPRNDVSTPRRERWLRGVLQWMVQNGGRESIPPCHGLAVTACELMAAFPFYSVDSSTWAVAPRYGHVIARSRRTGRPAQQDITAVYAGRQGPRQRSGLRSDNPAHAPLFAASTRDSIRAIQSEVDRCTRVWAARGIAWSDNAEMVPHAS